jgi:hypothetical protein
MLGAMALIAPARLATPPNGSKKTFKPDRPAFFDTASTRS